MKPLSLFTLSLILFIFRSLQADLFDHLNESLIRNQHSKDVTIEQTPVKINELHIKYNKYEATNKFTKKKYVNGLLIKQNNISVPVGKLRKGNNKITAHNQNPEEIEIYYKNKKASEKNSLKSEKIHIKNKLENKRILLGKNLQNIPTVPESEIVTNMNNGSLGVHQYYRPIKIAYDTKFLKAELEKLNSMDFYAGIKELFVKCDRFFKKYIKIKQEINQIINVPEYFAQCESKYRKDRFNFEAENFTMSVDYSADLVIFIGAYFEDSKELATALPCRTISTYNKRAIIGKIMINLKLLKLDQSDKYSFQHQFQTILHEVFHIFGFHKMIIEKFNRRNLDNLPHLKHLAQFYNENQQIKPYPLEQEGHWSAMYIPNDIMISKEKPNLILSIFSLEYMNLASVDLKIDVSQAENNNILTSLVEDDYWSYNCKADSDQGKKAKYDWLCTDWEGKNDYYGCSADFGRKTFCSSILNPDNQCRLKQYPDEQNCRNPMNINKDHFFEVFSDKSRCFSLQHRSKSACLNFDVINGNEIHIYIDKSIVVCKPGMTEVKFFYFKDQERYVSKLRCPDFVKFTAEVEKSCPFNCHFNGVCIEGVCSCYAGWSSNDHCETWENQNGAFSTSFVEV